MGKSYVDFSSWSLRKCCHVPVLNTLTGEREIAIYIDDGIEIENFVEVYCSGIFHKAKKIEPISWTAFALFELQSAAFFCLFRKCRFFPQIL